MIDNDNFSKSNIDKYGNVKLTDSNSELELYHYTECTNTDSDNLKQCRGLIYDKNNDKLLVQTFPYTVEYSNKEVTEIKNEITDINEWKYFPSYEGTIIRVFYHINWYISTNRKLDAFKSRWSSTDSFGKIFMDALTTEACLNNDFASKLQPGNILENLCLTLNKDHQYIFLVLNTSQNRIVCDVPSTNLLYHVGTFKNHILDLEDNINITKPQCLSFKKIDDVLDYVYDTKPHNIQGVICFHTKTNKQVKIVNINYKYFYDARGNTSSIKFRYLQVRMDNEQTNVLKYLYPTYIQIFEQYELYIHEIAYTIYQAYVNRFIKKQYITLPKEDFLVMKECQILYTSNRNYKITIQKVLTILNNQPATNINHMIKRLLLSKNTI